MKLLLLIAFAHAHLSILPTPTFKERFLVFNSTNTQLWAIDKYSDGSMKRNLIWKAP